MQYRGRFAPSATGALHLGSIFAALISYLDARHHHGTWLIRVDDLDRLRCKPEFNTLILNTLESFGLIPDEAPAFQSERIEQYQRALTQLDQHGLLTTAPAPETTATRPVSGALSDTPSEPASLASGHGCTDRHTRPRDKLR